MNEAEVLIYLLSRKKDAQNIGANKDELCSKLGFSDRNAEYKLWNLLQEFNKTIFPLGLSVKFNPMNSHWYIGFQDQMESNFGGATDKVLTPRLSATLFTILILYVSKTPAITGTKIQDLRNKKDIAKDLHDLHELGFIVYEKNQNIVKLTPKVFYYIEIDRLIKKIRELKELESKEEN
ncbi:MAG: hypothetical protein JW776_14965 [Candidatus Lokiarchaeota archaeon]|nr:hypothetical protein [Candidatus Lokiarchaeota archaeon]